MLKVQLPEDRPLRTSNLTLRRYNCFYDAQQHGIISLKLFQNILIVKC